MTEHTPYPGYDVMRKRDGHSWNDATRAVIDARLAIQDRPEFFSPEAWDTLNAICDRIIPQPPTRPRIPLAAYIDRDLVRGTQPGFRNIDLPPREIAWPMGLQAIEDEADRLHHRKFPLLLTDQQDALLKAVENGDVEAPRWAEIPAKLFFSTHLMSEIIAAYYAHPVAWSEIGYGGPASPRGYVRMHANERDPWEAASAEEGHNGKARKINQNVR